MYNYIIGLGSRHCLYKPSPGRGVAITIVITTSIEINGDDLLGWRPLSSVVRRP